MAYITPEIIVISNEERKMLTAARRGGGEPFLHSEIREISKCGLRKHEYLKQVINYFNKQGEKAMGKQMMRMLQKHPFHSLIVILPMIAACVSIPLNVKLSQQVIDLCIGAGKGTHSQTISSLAGCVTGLLLLLGINLLLPVWSRLTREKLYLAVKYEMEQSILHKFQNVSFSILEDAPSMDLISRVTEDPAGVLLRNFSQLAQIICGTAGIASILVYISIYSPLTLICLAALLVPMAVLSKNSGKFLHRFRKSISFDMRMVTAVQNALLSKEFAQERHVFGFADDLVKKKDRVLSDVQKKQLKAETKFMLSFSLLDLLSAAVTISMYALLLPGLIAGTFTIGLYLSLTSSMWQVKGFFENTLSKIPPQLVADREFWKEYEQFFTLQEDVVSKTDASQLFPAEIQSIAFEDVWFRYPGTETDVLKGVNFQMEKGGHYAFVGINGSGKTTLIKLLLGFYQPDRGRICINGRDISSFSSRERALLFACVFQDYAKYSVSLRDNIQFGKSDDDQLQKTVKHLHLEEWAEGLPQKYDTVLGKVARSGVELSEGQWQKISICRALNRNSPIVILDEPTASFDPIAESTLYTEYHQIFDRQLTLFISHRLGFTRIVDKIFLLSDGQIQEQGALQELLNQKGRFAEMYEQQKSWYSTEPVPENLRKEAVR